jgi:hypothetical protein
MSERKDVLVEAPLISIVVKPRKDVVVEAPTATAVVKS